MAAHSSVLAWRNPGTGEPGGLPSMGSYRVRHDWSDLAAAAAVLRDPLPKWSLTTIRLFKTSWHRLCWQNTQNLNYDRKLSGFCRKSAELFGRRQKHLWPHIWVKEYLAVSKAGAHCANFPPSSTIFAARMSSLPSRCFSILQKHSCKGSGLRVCKQKVLTRSFVWTMMIKMFLSITVYK